MLQIKLIRNRRKSAEIQIDLNRWDLHWCNKYWDTNIVISLHGHFSICNESILQLRIEGSDSVNQYAIYQQVSIKHFPQPFMKRTIISSLCVIG